MSALFFAQIREDSRVERRVIEAHPARRIVCIGSGGCTAFSLLSDAVEAIVCVDSNPAQCALIELKRVALLELEREAYLRFIGERPDPSRTETYTRLAPALPDSARAYWDARSGEVASGINHCGVTEQFYRFVGGNLRGVVCPDDVWQQLFDCRNLDEQRELYERYFQREGFQMALRVLLSKTSHVVFFPAFMFAQSSELDYGRFFAEKFEREVLGRPMSNNYFLSQLLFASYRHDVVEGVPHYLSPEGYGSARRNAHKLVVVPRPVEDFLVEEAGIDAFFLSNVFDWLTPEQRERLCRAVISASAPGAALAYRSMLSPPALPAEFLERVRVDEGASRALLEIERSMSYGRVTLGEIR
jgi:S-adenosylmethionine:diacylglycerol 3-amino-3-carboxypropyl transferase